MNRAPGEQHPQLRAGGDSPGAAQVCRFCFQPRLQQHWGHPRGSSPHLEDGVGAGGGGVGLGGALGPAFIAFGQQFQELLWCRGLGEKGQGLDQHLGRAPRGRAAPGSGSSAGPWQLGATSAASQEPGAPGTSPARVPRAPSTGADESVPALVPSLCPDLVEGEALCHDSFPGLLPDVQRALGLQQVIDTLLVHLEQDMEVRLRFNSLGGSWVPLQDLAQPGVPPDPTSGTSFHQSS